MSYLNENIIFFIYNIYKTCDIFVTLFKTRKPCHERPII